jgi:hypothetical protein
MLPQVELGQALSLEQLAPAFAPLTQTVPVPTQVPAAIVGQSLFALHAAPSFEPPVHVPVEQTLPGHSEAVVQTAPALVPATHVAEQTPELQSPPVRQVWPAFVPPMQRFGDEVSQLPGLFWH